MGLCNTHNNRAIPKVIGMKMNSTGTKRVWNTFWLREKFSNLRRRNRTRGYLQPVNRREEDTNGEGGKSSWNDVPVEGGSVLEDAELATTGGEKVTLGES